MRNRISKQTKTYVIDIGVFRLFSGIDKGKSLENAVFLELLMRKRVSDSINYLRLKSEEEVDFIVGGKTMELIEAATKLELRKGTVITYDYEGKETVDGISIEYVPFWI